MASVHAFPFFPPRQTEDGVMEGEETRIPADGLDGNGYAYHEPKGDPLTHLLALEELKLQHGWHITQLRKSIILGEIAPCLKPCKSN